MLVGMRVSLYTKELVCGFTCVTGIVKGSFSRTLWHDNFSLIEYGLCCRLWNFFAYLHTNILVFCQTENPLGVQVICFRVHLLLNFLRVQHQTSFYVISSCWCFYQKLISWFCHVVGHTLRILSPKPYDTMLVSARSATSSQSFPHHWCIRELRLSMCCEFLSSANLITVKHLTVSCRPLWDVLLLELRICPIAVTKYVFVSSRTGSKIPKQLM